MIQFSDQEISDERLVLDSATELYYLGHNLTLRNCTLVIKVPARALVIARTRLINCKIEAKRVLKNFRWENIRMQGCQFMGRFVGNDFGSWPGRSWPEAGLEDCDFTQAHLEECRFLKCEIGTLRLPRWPYFTLLDPGHRASELGRVPWPGPKGPIIGDVLAQTPPEARALTYAAPALAKWCGTTPEAIKAVLEKLDGVYY
jgi:hypothetical protein